MKQIDEAQNKSKKTNKKMMILSCIGIILVVLGHTKNQLGFASNIFTVYSFHMALFVFISGYFYNPKYEENIFGRKGYIIKKVKKLIIPYFIWNIIYGIIVTLARNLNIVSYGQPINFNSLFIKPWTTGHQYTLNIASWFLLALFLVNISYILLRTLLKKMKLWNDNVFLVIFFILALYAVYMSKHKIGENFIPLFRTLFFSFFYHFGYIYKTKIEGRLKINTVLYFIILIVINLILFKIGEKLSYEIVFMKFTGKTIIVPVLASITGILFYAKISEILEPALGNSKIINYISENTYSIMMHHLFWIFITNVIIFKVSGLLNLQGFDIDKFKHTIYYFYTAGVSQAAILYTIIATAMPLALKWVYDKVNPKDRIKNFKYMAERKRKDNGE